MRRKAIPKFKSENEEREFWSTHDSTAYLDWNKSQKILLPNLKPTMRSISIRLPEIMIAQLRTLANERDVPYQSLIKMIVKERLDKEFKTK